LPRKSWTEKLHNSKDFPRVERITEKMSKQWDATGTVVIPQPTEVDEVMRKVPRGKVTTINHIRQFLANRHGATICCPITAGIFANIAAHAAEEQKQQGKRGTTPYWRTLRKEGLINPKYPGGAEGQKKLLEREGHTIIMRGTNRYRVKNYHEKLAEF
jgi:alkylated DNA nucleotide flippase Atl1